MNTDNPMAAQSMPSSQVFRMVDARTAPTAKKSCGCGGCGCGGKGKGRRRQAVEPAQVDTQTQDPQVN